MELKQDNKHNIRLTSAEISSLWTTYVNNTMSKCVLSYFLSKVQDSEIRSVIEYALDVSQKGINDIESIFKEEKYPIPIGFTDRDVNINAPRLFSDKFFINYIDQMAKTGFFSYGMSASLSSRLDIQELFNRLIKYNIDINTKSKAVLLSKGIHLRPPSIPKPKKVDFVNKQSFLTGWFGRRKPLLAVEIADLYHNLQTNSIGKALITGFAQTAETEDARDYLKRGKEISSKHIKIFTSILTEEDIPVPRNWDEDVLDSTEAAFSDKLMMFHISLLSSSGIGNYGGAISTSTRRDLATHFSRLLTEIAQYTEDGANLQIKHGWMEQPPQSVDNNDLIKK